MIHSDISTVRGEWFDYDPFTGLTEYFEQHADGTVSIHTYQDVQPYLDMAAELRNSGSTEGNFRGEGWQYAALPMIAILKMREKGFNALGVHGKDGTKYLLKEINQNYPHFKTTHRHHAIK
jgi:hypothetical protein